MSQSHDDLKQQNYSRLSSYTYIRVKFKLSLFTKNYNSPDVVKYVERFLSVIIMGNWHIISCFIKNITSLNFWTVALSETVEVSSNSQSSDGNQFGNICLQDRCWKVNANGL